MSFAAFLSSSVVGGLIAGFVALQNSERKIQIENVTQERAKWREKIRIKSSEVHQAAFASNALKLSELRLEFSINLNPFDTEDKNILSVIANLIDCDNRDAKLVEFSDRIALLLKHDWQRAKYETRPWCFRWHTPKRMPYAEFSTTKP